MYVFGGLQNEGIESDEFDDLPDMPEHVSTMWSYQFATGTWRPHWWEGLPCPSEFAGSPLPLGFDPSNGPKAELTTQGALLSYTDTELKQTLSDIELCRGYSLSDIQIFWASRNAMSRPCDNPYTSPRPYHDTELDAVWIFRNPNLQEFDHIGYWVKVPTVGQKPSSFLKGHQLRRDRGNRHSGNCTVLIPDKDGDGVRVITWGGLYWTGEHTDTTLTVAEQERAARANVAMNGMFELHISKEHLKTANVYLHALEDASSCSPRERLEGTDMGHTVESTPPLPPQWSLLPQHGSDRPMVRHNHTMTVVGRDLIVIGGEAVHGMPPQEPAFVGTSEQLGNFAFNLDSFRWRRLKFTPLRADHHEECISSHLAFALPISELQKEQLHASREALLAAALCFRACGGGVQINCQHIWRDVWSFLVAPGRGRLLGIRQFDDIHRHEDEAHPLDNLVVLFDLLTLEWYPLSTAKSMAHNARHKDDWANKAPLNGMDGGHWINASTFNDPESGALRLLAHGKLSTKKIIGTPHPFAATVH
jgi:hypothetical protein